jgi:hypothetical protein
LRLIASAIWAGLAFFSYKVKREFEAESERYRSLFERLKDVISNDIEPLFKQDLYLSLNILSKRFICKLGELYNSRIVLVIVLIYYCSKIDNTQVNTANIIVVNIIVVFMYIILIIYETYEIKRIKDRIDDFDMAILRGMSTRLIRK